MGAHPPRSFFHSGCSFAADGSNCRPDAQVLQPVKAAPRSPRAPVSLDTTAKGPEAPRSRRSRHGSLLKVAVLVIAFFHGLLYVVQIPAWDINDEQAHLTYTLSLRDHHTLPLLSDRQPAAINASVLATGSARAFHYHPPEPGEPTPPSYEAHHPPLYYLTAWPVSAIGGGDVLHTLYAVRMLGPFLLVALVAIAWSLARAWFPAGASVVGPTAALAVAASPAAAEAAGRVSNDLAVAVLVALTILGVTRMVGGPTRSAAALTGLSMAGAVLTKESGLVVLPVVVVGLIMAGRRHRVSLGMWATALMPAALALFAWGLWLHAHYGAYDSSGALATVAHYFDPQPPAELVHRVWRSLWSTFWADYQVDNLQLVLTNVLLIALAVVGVFGLAWRHPRPRLAIVLGATMILAMLASLIPANLSSLTLPQARLVLPALLPTVVLVVGGWASLWRSRLAAAVPAMAAWAAEGAFFSLWWVPFFGWRR